MRIKTLDEAAVLFQDSIIDDFDGILGGKTIDLSDGYFGGVDSSGLLYMDDNMFYSLSNFSYNATLNSNTFVYAGYINIRIVSGAVDDYGNLFFEEGYDENTGYYNLHEMDLVKIGEDENWNSVYKINDVNFGYASFNDHSNQVNLGYTTEILSDGYVKSISNGYQYFTKVKTSGSRLTKLDLLNNSYDSRIVHTTTELRTYNGTLIPPAATPVWNDPQIWADLNEGGRTMKAYDAWASDPVASQTPFISPRRKEMEKQFPTVYGGSSSLSAKYQGWNDFAYALESSINANPSEMKDMVKNTMEALWYKSGQNWEEFTKMVDGYNDGK